MARASYKDWLTPDGLLAIESWARDGLTDDQIIEKIGCSASTFYKWQKDFSEFSEALKRGKRPVDIEVENALLKKALGFEYEEIEEIYEGNELIRSKVNKKVSPPDTSAAIFWLKNRKPDIWRRMSDEFKSKTDAETKKLEKETELAQANLEKLQAEMAKEDKQELPEITIVDRWGGADD